MRAKYRNKEEFEAVLSGLPLHLFATSGSKRYGIEWKRYKSGDPAEDNIGDLSVVLRHQGVTERIDNAVTRFDPKMNLYKRVRSFATFKINAMEEEPLWGSRHLELFEIGIDWNYIGGIDPI